MFKGYSEEPSYRQLYAAVFASHPIKRFNPYEIPPIDSIQPKPKTSFPTPLTTRYKTHYNPRAIKIRNSINSPATSREHKSPITYRSNPNSPLPLKSKVETTLKEEKPIESKKEHEAKPKLILKGRKRIGLKIDAKKLRWYDMRPRLLINRYYRKNFILNFTHKKDNVMSIAQILKQPLHAKSLSYTPNILFDRSIFTAEPVKSSNNEQIWQLKINI